MSRMMQPADLVRRDDEMVMRNLRVDGRRTTVRLEPAYWEALDQICEAERMSRDRLCDMVFEAAGRRRLTANLRLFLLNYFRAGAAAAGEAAAA